MELFLIAIINTKETLTHSFKFRENSTMIYIHNNQWHFKIIDLNCVSLGKRKINDWYVRMIGLAFLSLVPVIFKVVFKSNSIKIGET